MRRIYPFVLALVLMGATVQSGDEVYFVAVSASTSSTTETFPNPCSSACLCNQGSDTTYYRLFTDAGVAVAATSANGRLPAGSATDPYCVCFTHNPKTESGTGYLHVSIIADSSTATVDVTAK